MKLKFLILTILFVIPLAACGKAVVPSPEEGPNSPPPDPEVGVKAVVPLFGAPWCGVCKKRLPEIQEEYEKLSASQKSRVELRLYCPDESQESCEKYAKALHLNIEAFADPRWKFFKKWVSKSLAIPGAAVLNADSSKVLKSFPPGNMFLPKDIVDFAVKVE
jgi:thiol-disulfide isomerase/thioredoxin